MGGQGRAQNIQHTASLKEGSVVWFSNEKYQEDDILDNFPPFFQAKVLKLTDTHAKLQLKTDQVKCNEDMYNSDPIFDIELSKVQPSN